MFVLDRLYFSLSFAWVIVNVSFLLSLHLSRRRLYVQVSFLFKRLDLEALPFSPLRPAVLCFRATDLIPFFFSLEGTGSPPFFASFRSLFSFFPTNSYFFSIACPLWPVRLPYTRSLAAGPADDVPSTDPFSSAFLSPLRRPRCISLFLFREDSVLSLCALSSRAPPVPPRFNRRTFECFSRSCFSCQGFSLSEVRHLVWE